MKFWASAEVFKPADAALERVRKTVEPFLNEAFARSNLSTLDGLLRYVPIAMPKDMIGRYPERSKLRKKQRIYDCSPQLNYEIFLDDSFHDQLKEYLRGVALSAPHLVGLGASCQQIEAFCKILESAERVLLQRPDQPRE